MIREVGRLEPLEIKEIEKKVDKVFSALDNEKIDSAKKQIIKIASTQNYYVRELLGIILAKYPNTDKMDMVALELLDHKIYGVRAAVLFYYYRKHRIDPMKVIICLDMAWETTPWEVEAIIYELWKDYPSVMKEKMLEWVNDDNEKKRALSFHGLENVAMEDPLYVLDYVSKAIDDESLEVQKKITHILTQVAKIRPAESYPFIREWLLNGNETRVKTISVSMKKLAGMVTQRNRKDKSEEFMILTQQTVLDWKNDENEYVSSLGSKLYSLINQN